MLKRFVIVCLCAVAVISVFNLQDNLTYEGFEHAASMFEANVNDFKDDIETISLMALVIEQFTAQDGFIIRHEEGLNAILVTEMQIMIDEETGEEIRVPVPVSFYFHDTFLADRLYGLLDPISGFKETEGFFDVVVNAVNAVVFILRCLVTLVFLVLTFLFDTVKIALQAVRAGMYLVGLSS